MDAVLLPSRYAAGVTQSPRRQHSADLIIMGCLWILIVNTSFPTKGNQYLKLKSPRHSRERLQPRDCFAIAQISITASVFTGLHDELKLP